MNTNAFGVDNSTGRFIFEKESRINHSCAPNAQYDWWIKARVHEIMSVKDISAGEEITVSYLGYDRPDYAVRQARLKESYGFYCNCWACGEKLDGKDLPRDLMGSQLPSEGSDFQT